MLIWGSKFDTAYEIYEIYEFFLMIPFKIEIECSVKRCRMGTLGGKGLNKFVNFHFFNPLLPEFCLS